MAPPDPPKKRAAEERAAAGKRSAPVASKPARGRAAPAGPFEPPVRPAPFHVERRVLGNGLTVLVQEDHTVPALSFWTFFRVGSRNERPGITGISHLFEHMMFNGTRKFGPKAFDHLLESNGGYSNAYTDRDLTAYYENVPSDRLDLVLDLESDRMRDLDISETALAAEREVVKEERRLRTDNSISGQLDELLWAQAYVAHPYHAPIVGWIADLDRITREDCQDYFRTHYAPNNAIVVVCGDVDPPDALVRVESAYSAIPAQAAAEAVPRSEPVQRGERRAWLHTPAQLVSANIGWHVPAVGHPDLYALDVLEYVLAGGESSRLYHALIYERQVALSVSSAFRWRLDPALFELYLEMKPGEDAATGEAICYEEIDRIAADGVPERELEKAKNQLEAALVRSLKTNEARAETIGTYYVWFADPYAMLQAGDRYRQVTSDDVRRVARTYFHPLNRTIVTVVPDETVA